MNERTTITIQKHLLDEINIIKKTLKYPADFVDDLLRITVANYVEMRDKNSPDGLSYRKLLNDIRNMQEQCKDDIIISLLGDDIIKRVKQYTTEPDSTQDTDTEPDDTV